MSSYLIDQIERHSNIDVQLGVEVAEVKGDQRLEEITVRDRETGETQEHTTPAMFVFIGASPHTEMLGDLVELSEAGFVLTGPDLFIDRQKLAGWSIKREPYLMETSVPGIFAAGDVRHGVLRRVASAVGQGSTAISFVHEYLKTV